MVLVVVVIVVAVVEIAVKIVRSYVRGGLTIIDLICWLLSSTPSILNKVVISFTVMTKANDRQKKII